MHRYVALIATSEDQDSFDNLAHSLARRFTDWQCALDGHRAKAWVTASPHSPIGYTSYGPSGCLIGVELGDRQPAPWDGTAGQGFLARSWGAYVAIQIGQGHDVVITRDPSGRIPCWTSHLHGADVYFSDIDDVPEVVPASGDPIDWDYIQYYLNVSGAYGAQTGLKAVAELLPGRQIHYSGGSGRQSSGWPLAEIAGSPFESFTAAEAGLRAATAEAVGGWARKYDRIALDLSGGFDSAVVLGLIREQSPDAQILGINYLIAHPEGDERSYAHEAADRHGIPLLVEPISAQGQRFDLNKALHWLRPKNTALPSGAPEARSRAASRIDAKAAFTGSGGDHVFGQSVPPSMLAEAVRDRLPLPTLFTIAHDYAKMSQDTFWNISWATIKDLWGADRALKTLIQTSNYYLTRDAVESTNFERFAHPDVIEVGDLLSSAKLHQLLGFHELNDHYVRYSPEFKPDEVNPLQSQLVLEASLRIPSYWMNPAGRRRGLARRAFHDLVPEIILKRRGKSSTTSHGLQILTDNIQFLRNLMLDGYLVQKNLLDRDKLERTFSHQNFSKKEDMIGLLKIISTEIWVQSNSSRFNFSTYNPRFTGAWQ